jgi:phospholipid/cholesterol/gamma-HCH transport system substrate-binding protein
MSTPINKKRTAIVGIFIVVGLLFFLGGILTIGNLHSTFSKKMTIFSIFGNVNGLVAGNNIWFSGVKIGTVKSTEFFGKSEVKVVMNINIESREYIREDAKVKISTDGFIGNKIMVIYGGTAASPAIKQDDALSNEVMLSTEDIMATFQQNNLNVLAITQKLKNGEGTIGRLLNSDSLYNSVSISANSLQITAKSLQLAAKDARGFVTSLSDFGTKLNQKGNLANELVTDKVVFNSVKTSVAKLEQTVTKLQNFANDFTQKLNKEGSLVNELVTDTLVFNSLKSSVFQIKNIADTAATVMNSLKKGSSNAQSPIGVLLNDKETGDNLKTTLKNLESSSAKLDKDLEALQHSFLLRGFFRKEAKKK